MSYTINYVKDIVRGGLERSDRARLLSEALFKDYIEIIEEIPTSWYVFYKVYNVVKKLGGTYYKKRFIIPFKSLFDEANLNKLIDAIKNVTREGEIDYLRRMVLAAREARPIVDRLVNTYFGGEVVEAFYMVDQDYFFVRVPDDICFNRKKVEELIERLKNRPGCDQYCRERIWPWFECFIAIKATRQESAEMQSIIRKYNLL